MKCILMFVLLFTVAVAFANEMQPNTGTAVFKLKPEFRREMQLSGTRTGVTSLDDKLKRLNVSGLKQRFLTPKNVSHDISLIFSVSSPYPAQAVVNVLATDPHVQYAEVIYPDEVFAVPNDADYSLSQYFAALEAEAAWDIHKGESGSNPVILAIADTGVKWSHVDLAENIWNNLGEDANANGYTLYHNGSTWVMDAGDINGIDDDNNGKIDDLIGWDFTVSESGGESNDPQPPGSHGTAVSGIMAARTNNTEGTSSLPWNLTLMPLSCSYNDSYIYTGYEGIIYAAEKGADVINCSWGGTSFSQANQEVINYTFGLGSIIVAAAGNSNRTLPIYPAAYRNVLATAALQNSGLKSTASNYGAYVDFGATNSMIRTTLVSGGYATVNTGVNNATSYASPVASALMGLTKSYYPSLTNTELITRLKGSCDDIDSLNPSYVEQLGEGKLNARRALADVAPVPDNEIRLYLQDNYAVTEPNGNRAIEPGETFSTNFRLRNYGFSASAASFVLSTTSTDVTILDNTVIADIPEDDYFSFTDAFSIYVLPTAVSQYVTFTITTLASIPVAVGGTLTFSIPINAGGVLVWEAVAGSRNMSGSYLKTQLQTLGYTCAYGTTFPFSFYNFDAVFLCFGTPGYYMSRFDQPYMFTALREYLEAGGKVYIEGGDVVGYDMAMLLPDVDGELDAYEVLWPLLGIQSADDGATNVIDLLEGATFTPTEGINFSSSLQTVSSSIDTFTPLSSNARAAFTESDYGCVAVANTGALGQRTLVFSYALRELVDGTFPSTKANLVSEIMDFFETDSFIGELEAPILIITTLEDSIHVSWSAIENADYYHVYASEKPDDWSGVTPVIVYDTSYTCASENKKFYKVIAVCE
ncbi:MAG: serine peptidase precursor [Candidatus Cloacimonetes bacterium HGW-Cloacimonetes-3]|nr:MAG: serine peptidase precursor [Candidatus Cloacimonetes bacterium HGW-Cloacimonetes-3]